MAASIKNPYENQLIGAFVFALGQHHGRRFPTGDTAPFGVNLFQQTPLDRAYSDLILGRDHCVVLEFKRTRADVAGERAKWSTGALAAFANNPELTRTANHVHLVVYPEAAADAVNLNVCTYLDALGLTPSQKLERFTAARLIQHLIAVEAGEVEPIGAPAEVISRYLETLWCTRHAQGESTGAPASAWVGVVQGPGGLRLVAAGSLGHLLGRGRSLTTELERRRTAQRSLERSREHDDDRGLDLSL